MDTLHLTTKPDSDTAATKPGKTGRDGQPAGKVDKAPTAKRDRKATPVTKDASMTVTDEPTGEGRTVTTEVKVTPTEPEPTAEDPTVSNDAPVTAKDPEPTAQEPEVSDSTLETTAPTVTDPKKPTKADLEGDLRRDGRAT